MFQLDADSDYDPTQEQTAPQQNVEPPVLQEQSPEQDEYEQDDFEQE